jgi:hypothetical protein
VELLPHAHKDILRNLIGRFRSSHPACEVEDPPEMGMVNALERLCIPLSSKGNIVHRH